jgi:hypothetical protein
MNDRHNVDASVGKLARMSDEQIFRLAGSSGREALLEEIMLMSTDQPRTSRGRLRTVLVAAISILVVGGTAAASWAIANGSTRDTISIQCEIAGHDTIIPSASGNAVQDCAAQWKRDTGASAPKLVAYDNGHGGITVEPADQPPPSGATKLPSGSTQNVTLVDLQESLDDYLNGLNSGCYTNSTAADIAQRNLTALGLASWKVIEAPASDFAATAATQAPGPASSSGPATSEQSPSNQSSRCVATAILDPVARTVSLRALSGPPNTRAAFEKLAAKLSAFTGCVPLNVAAQQVRAAATQLGLSEAKREYQVTEVAQASATCTTIHETVGGAIFITLRGPVS